ncbi:MAG: phospho-sugar mutase, partial [Opitutales bacterium]|nr:phospho-sugar mutase [Opitutales bacterium]
MNEESKILSLAKDALEKKLLLPSARENICAWAGSGVLPEWALKSVLELFEKGAFEELNDRFFKTLEFGTAGMRGRTIGKVCAASELGKVSEFGTPQNPAVGSNCMNDFNVARATLGLFKYCKEWCDKNSLGAPSLVIACDVRHFSKHFCELAASIWAKLGGKVKIFDGPRSTPQLSYTVIKDGAIAGIVITASHNPACDNGYKVYFSDGAQITSPHAEGIVSCVNSVSLSDIKEFLGADLSRVGVVEKSLEEAYIKSLEDCVIDKGIMRANAPKIVFTPVHGTGAVLCPEVMRHFGLEPILQE